MDIFVIEIVDADNVHIELLKQFQKREITDFKKWNTHCLSYLMVDRILRDFYQIENREIVFEGKKPVLKTGEKHFSISHSGQFIAIAFSDYNCGVDIEEIKPREFEKISQRMGFKANTLGEFYNEWTKYEAEYKLSVPAQKTKIFNLEGYSICSATVNIKEEFEMYIQSGQYIPE